MSEGEEGRGIGQVCRALWVGAASLDFHLEGGGSPEPRRAVGRGGAAPWWAWLRVGALQIC